MRDQLMVRQPASQRVPIVAPNLLADEYDTQTELPPSETPMMPIAFVLTEFHYLLLYEDRLVVMSRLSSEVVHTERFLKVRNSPPASLPFSQPALTHSLVLAPYTTVTTPSERQRAGHLPRSREWQHLLVHRAQDLDLPDRQRERQRVEAVPGEAGLCSRSPIRHRTCSAHRNGIAQPLLDDNDSHQ